MDEIAILGTALRLLRLQRGKTQKEVAEAAGIRGPMLSGYENGGKVPALKTLLKLLKALGCSLTDLEKEMHRLESEGSSGRTVLDRRAVELRRSASGEAAGLAELEERSGDVAGLLGIEEALPAPVEESFAIMLQGFQKFLRYLAERSRG